MNMQDGTTTSSRGDSGRFAEPSADRPTVVAPGVLLEGPDVAACEVMVVGDDAFASQVADSFARARLIARTCHVRDYLMALGQLAHVKPGLLLGQAELLGAMRDAYVQALRQMTPTAKLYVVVSGQQEKLAVEALEAGFDGALREPLASDELRAVVARVAAAAAAAAASSSSSSSVVERAGSGGVSSGFAWPGRAGLGRDVARDATAVQEASVSHDVSRGETPRPTGAPQLTGTPQKAQRADEAQQSGVVRQQTQAGAQGDAGAEAGMSHGKNLSGQGAAEAGGQVTAGELGDVDLIDGLLQRPELFESLLLQLVTARSGVAQLALAGDAAQVPQDHAGAWVVYRGQRLAVLHAPLPATKGQLVPWALWLGHWLALHRQMDTLWQVANHDELTGAWNRRYFDRHLAAVIEQAMARRSPVTLLLFDIDNFKTYNDRYGHPAGDEILCETVRLMRSVVREHDVVARIGGDEFAVIFWDPQGPRRQNSAHPHDVLHAARRFQKAICSHHFPKLLEEAPGTLTISGGLASFPWDGTTPEALLQRADAMLLHSKSQGKNAITFGPGAARACDPFEH